MNFFLKRCHLTVNNVWATLIIVLIVVGLLLLSLWRHILVKKKTPSKSFIIYIIGLDVNRIIVIVRFFLQIENPMNRMVSESNFFRNQILNIQNGNEKKKGRHVSQG